MAKGKRKLKGKSKGKSKMEQSANPFGSGKGGVPSLPPWPVWNNPEVATSPFQTAQSNKSSTMQEMAVHLRQAYKDSEAPADVQAFLDKADKEYSRNNIKSLQAATKSLDHAQKALRDAVNAKKEHRLQWTKHVGDGIKVWEAQLESYRVHQATLSEHAARARAEIETSRRILKEVSDNSVKEGNLSIPQPIQEETEDAGLENAVDSEELKLRDQLQGVLNACAGSLGLQVAAPEQSVQEVSDEDKEQPPQHKRPSVDPAKPGFTKQ
jgi:myosin heavy subunit